MHKKEHLPLSRGIFYLSIPLSASQLPGLAAIWRIYRSHSRFWPDIAAIAFCCSLYSSLCSFSNRAHGKGESSFLVRVERISASIHHTYRRPILANKNTKDECDTRFWRWSPIDPSTELRRAGILVIELWCTHDSLWMAQQGERERKKKGKQVTKHVPPVRERAWWTGFLCFTPALVTRDQDAPGTDLFTPIIDTHVQD